MEARSKMTREEETEYTNLQTKYLSKRVKEETNRFSDEFRKIFFSENGKQKILGYLENKLLVADLL